MIDGGYLGVWSGSRSPAEVDPELLGIDDPAVADDIRGAVDFEVVGPDAAAATVMVRAKQPGISLYDVPASSAADFQSAFDSLCRNANLDATLRATERVPHRERARRCGTDGGGFLAFVCRWSRSVGCPGPSTVGGCDRSDRGPDDGGGTALRSLSG